MVNNGWMDLVNKTFEKPGRLNQIIMERGVFELDLILLDDNLSSRVV